MATNAFVKLDLPAANDLADLTGIKYDLESAKDFALRLRAMVSAGQMCDVVFIDALSTATLVRYSRAFVSGVRQPLQKEALHQLSNDQQRKHEYFLALRHKHIAHSVNTLEESALIAKYWVERVEVKGISSIECNYNTFVSLGSNDFDDIAELSDVLLQFVNKKIKEEKTRLLPIVRAMPLDEVLSGGRGARVPGASPVSKSRKRRRGRC